jgi:hypothetical protein
MAGMCFCYGHSEFLIMRLMPSSARECASGAGLAGDSDAYPTRKVISSYRECSFTQYTVCAHQIRRKLSKKHLQATLAVTDRDTSDKSISYEISDLWSVVNTDQPKMASLEAAGGTMWGAPAPVRQLFWRVRSSWKNAVMRRPEVQLRPAERLPELP